VHLILLNNRNIETILKHIDKKKYSVPDEWSYEQARELFKEPDVLKGDAIDLKWTEPDEEGLIAYMVTEKGFAEDRIRNGAKKLAKARTTTQQGRLDSFFTVSHTVSATTPNTKKVEVQNATNKGLKRKNGPANDTTPKGKAGGGSGRKFK